MCITEKKGLKGGRVTNNGMYCFLLRSITDMTLYIYMFIDLVAFVSIP